MFRQRDKQEHAEGGVLRLLELIWWMHHQYVRDINKDNPIGTGGELAKAFANLLIQLWKGDETSVFPRNFKTALGRHAEQFMGYDQQDSQELIAYLLDGIHEDLNRGQ